MSAIVFESGGDPTTDVTIVGNTGQSAEYLVEIISDVKALTVVGNTVDGGILWVGGAEVSGVAANNTSYNAVIGVGVAYDGALDLTIAGNTILDPKLGIQLTESSSGGPEGVHIAGNTIKGAGIDATTNTRDGIRVEAGQAVIEGNKITPRTGTPFTRSAVYLDTDSHDCVVVGNDFGDVSEYATGGYVDNGTGNVNTYPADVTYGDNFTR